MVTRIGQTVLLPRKGNELESVLMGDRTSHMPQWLQETGAGTYRLAAVAVAMQAASTTQHFSVITMNLAAHSHYVRIVYHWILPLVV